VSALDLSELDIAGKTLAGRVVIQVLTDLRCSLATGVVLDERALNVYEGLKLGALRILEPQEASHSSAQAEGAKR